MARREWIEVDGMILGGGGSSGGGALGGLMGGLGGLLGGGNKAETFLPIQRWIRIERVDEIYHEDHDIRLQQPDAPRVRRQVPAFAINLGDEPAAAAAADMDVEDGAEAAPDMAPTAPAGWWLLHGTTRYHVRDGLDDQVRAIVDQPDENRVALALHRLVEEIALKPAHQEGSMMDAARHSFVKSTLGEGEE